MSEVKAKLFEIEFPCRWGDMDALGHVNNTVYFRYFENVRTEWLREQGYEISPLATQGPVIVDATCQFLIAAVYPAQLRVILYGGVPGRSSFNTYYELRDAGEPDRLYCTGSSRVVWVDYAKGGSVPVPEQLRQLLPG